MEKMKIFIVDLESVPTRYTCEWKTHLPVMLMSEADRKFTDVDIINISGGEESIEASPGAFLNFQATNIYKNNQMNEIARRFTNDVKPGDKFIFTDAWHTGILQLKYMSELLGIPVEIHALWHAGSYDEHDFLGRLIKDKKWTYATESALFHAIDHNYFATNFHIDTFVHKIPERIDHPGERQGQIDQYIESEKIVRSGWPMEYMPTMFSQIDHSQKEDIIIFPHRIAPEKQPEIFRDLAMALPEYQFVLCQDRKLAKEDYHKLLAKSKVLWSANLQETLGISPFEGALLGVIPLLPDRLSYTEMYDSKYLYPSIWTESFSEYLKYKHLIIDRIRDTMNNYNNIDVRRDLAPALLEQYFTATQLVTKLLRR